MPQAAHAIPRSMLSVVTASVALIGAIALPAQLQAAGTTLSGSPAAANHTVDTKSAPAAQPAIIPPATDPAAINASAAQHKVDVETARARCTALLATISAVAIPQDPIEDGSCGTLAPIELVSVGKNPQVALSPPAVINCDMAVAIHNWMKTDVQPLARKHLGREVVRIETMSSYSCRNAYGRTLSKLSEHGRANALDVRGFVTATGQTAYVLSDWGLTSGEIRAAAVIAQREQAAREVAAAAEAKAQAEQRARALAAAKAPSNGTQAAPNPIANAGTLIEGLPNPALSFGGHALAKSGTDLGLSQSSRLGGPKRVVGTSDNLRVPIAAPVADAAAGDPNTVTATSLFLRAVHDSACLRFATTLGPETNAAHRNHFHIDLAERATKKNICE